MGGEIQKKVKEICKEYHNIIQIHGFYLNEESKEVSFDVVFNFDEKKSSRDYSANFSKTVRFVSSLSFFSYH